MRAEIVTTRDGPAGSAGVPEGVAASAGCAVEWRSLAALEPQASEWRRLATRAIEPNVFYDPAFALAAAPSLGDRVRVALVRSSTAPAQLLGLFPVQVEHRYGPLFPVLTGWTHDYAPFGTPLVDRDAAEAVIEAFLTFLAGDPGGAQVLLLPYLPEEGPFAKALDRVLARRQTSDARLGRHHRALLVPRQGHAGALDGLIPAKRRKEFRRLRRRLEASGSVTLATARDAATVAPALAEYLALEARGWKGRAGTAMAEHPGIHGFVERALRDLAVDGMARIDRLLLDGRAVAAGITLRSGNTAWFWKIAYDETHAAASPGLQLALDLTRSLVADPSLARTDSCAVPDHPMIDHVWRERLAISDRLIAVGRGSEFAFMVARRLEALRRGGIAAAKNLRGLLRGR